MKRPSAQQVGDGLMVGVAVAPWALAAVRLHRARQAAPLEAVAWFRVWQACKSTGLQVGRAGLYAEARYWEVIRHGRG